MLGRLNRALSNASAYGIDIVIETRESQGLRIIFRTSSINVYSKLRNQHYDAQQPSNKLQMKLLILIKPLRDVMASNTNRTI